MQYGQIKSFEIGQKVDKEKILVTSDTTGKFDLQRHITNAHEENKPLECSFCQVKFSQKETLNRHIESVHEGQKSYKCNIYLKIYR